MVYATFIRLNEQEQICEARLTEPYTRFDCTCNITQIKKLMHNGMEIANIKLKNNHLYYADWPYIITHSNIGEHMAGSEYVLLGRDQNGDFLVTYMLGVRTLDENNLLQSIHDGRVANCIETADGIKTVDTMNLIPHEETIKKVENAYNIFLSKANLLGLDMRFEYSFVGDKVILNNYIGKSKNVIVPGFVYGIADGAFLNTHIEEIELTEGLRVIGNFAFFKTNLKKLVIPESVQIIGRDIVSFREKTDIKYKNKSTLDTGIKE